GGRDRCADRRRRGRCRTGDPALRAARRHAAGDRPAPGADAPVPRDGIAGRRGRCVTLALGVLLGTGVCLIASPWLWPADAGRSVVPGPAERVRGWLARAGFERVPIAVFAVLCAALGAATGSVVGA